jgi:hypothetical protein
MKITVTHRSQEEIKAIRPDGRFDEFMFFTAYSANCGGYSYSVTLDESSIIDATSIFHHEEAALLDGLVERFCARFEVDTDDAEDIISERKQLRDFVDSADAEDDFDVQVFTARAAKMLGFRGVRVSDEFGTSYMIDMMGRESELMSA